MFWEIVDKILRIFAILAIFYVIIAYFRVFKTEKKLKKIYKEVNDKIEEEKKKPVMMSVMDGRIGQIRENSRVIIEDMERKRKYILDKIPFIK